ncbi:MAG: TonB-dependent receptor [Cellvibrionaceae bacterium]|nr:TonB-dependent receptor [Cellvibrionaceae bacterium]
MKHSAECFALSLLSVLVATAAMGDAEDAPILEEMLVTGGKDNIQTLSGSAQLIDEDTLEQFDFSDLNQALGLLPGVYIRSEDGYGLRPNIGIRGVSSERSQKITLMEDGVLIKPAPYSAPAAYYIPNISRMSAVEVVKGPASIKQGPNNVGGAINLVTPAIPEDRQGFIDASIGSFDYQKYEVFYGNSHGDFGYWVDALHYSSEGFKTLENGADTGFERNDFNTKLQWRPSLWGYQQRFTLKLGYADEGSDETYLGQTAPDFAQDPDRRYAASQLDRFESEHAQLHLDHLIDFSSTFKLNTKVYWNRYERSWNKLDGFIGAPYVDLSEAGVDVRDVLGRNNGSLFPRLLGILRGEIDSRPLPVETLDVTNNDRKYGSSGIQFKADYLLEGASVQQHIEIGLRYHSDYIERDHTTRGYLMTAGTLVNDGIEWGSKTINEAQTDALAVFVNDTLKWRDWTFNAGLRVEDIDAEAEDFLNPAINNKSQTVLAPGAGAFWQFSDTLGFLVGVNKGFSPAGASAGEDVDPEESLNYEYGLRYQNGSNRAEVIGFFSDYENLLGRCRASDSGCEVGEELNGGGVEVAGVEMFAEWFLPTSGKLQYPVNFNYTYTESAFQSSFNSSFPQWGNVQQGDELPYLPQHVGRLQLGVQASDWDAYLAFNYTSEMRDEAGQGSIDSVLHSEALSTVDLSVIWQASSRLLLQSSVDNVFDEQVIVSWRPFGARPNRPRTLRLRLRYAL